MSLDTTINVLTLILYDNEVTYIIIGYLYVYIHYEDVTTGGNWVKHTWNFPVLFVQLPGNLSVFQNKEWKKLAQFSLWTQLGPDSVAGGSSSPLLPPTFPSSPSSSFSSSSSMSGLFFSPASCFYSYSGECGAWGCGELFAKRQPWACFYFFCEGVCRWVNGMQNIDLLLWKGPEVPR